jgi:hypothetical protein
MLLRIAPDMFVDDRFECVTIQTVRRELFGTTKFKDKYPWRTQFKTNLKTVPTLKLDATTLSVVNATADEHFNERTGRPYNLSSADKEVAAYALSKGWDVSTGDTGLIDFLTQQFQTSVLSALEVLNYCLEQNVVSWSERLHAVLVEWATQGERPQPLAAKKRFTSLTGKKYPGP